MSTHPDATRRVPLSRPTLVTLAVAVVLATIAGAVIGAQVMIIGCDTGCGTVATVGGIVGAAFAGAGTAIIGVLVARAFTEWDAWKSKDAGDAAAPGD